MFFFHVFLYSWSLICPSSRSDEGHSPLKPIVKIFQMYDFQNFTFTLLNFSLPLIFTSHFHANENERENLLTNLNNTECKIFHSCRNEALATVLGYIALKPVQVFDRSKFPFLFNCFPRLPPSYLLPSLHKT